MFIAQEGLEIMMALDSAKGIVLNVHEKKKGDLQQGTESPPNRDACPCRIQNLQTQLLSQS